MCWWRQNNVEDDSDAHEALLAEENTVVAPMRKGKKTNKEKQYEDIMNKYRRTSAPPQQSTSERPDPVPCDLADPIPEHQDSNKTVTRTTSDSQYSKSKNNSVKSKSNLKNSQSAPSASMSSNSDAVRENEVQKVQKGLSERGDLLQDVAEKTEELQQNSRHFRSVSKRLKDKQAQKLKKTKLPW